MGNIISYYLQGPRESESAYRKLGDDETAECLDSKPGEFQRRANEGDEIENRERADADRARADAEQSGEVPNATQKIDEFNIESTLVNIQSISKVLSSLKLDTNTELIKTLETTVINAYLDVEKTCLQLISDASTDELLKSQISSTEIGVDTLASFLQVFKDSSDDETAKIISQQINENMKLVVTLAAQALNTLKLSIKEINARWHSVFDNNENIKSINALMAKYAIDVSEFVELKASIDDIIKEGDDEYSKLNSTLISGDVASAIQTINEVCSYLYDLNDDDAALTEANNKLTTLAEQYKLAATAYVQEQQRLALKKQRDEDIAAAKSECESLNARIVNYESELSAFSSLDLNDEAASSQLQSLYSAFMTSIKNSKYPSFDIDVLNDELWTQLQTSIKSFKENATVIDNAYSEFTRYLASATGDISTLYSTIIAINSVKISDYESKIEADKSRMKTNYEQASESMKTMNSNDELIQLQSKIKTAYDQAFIRDNSKNAILKQAISIYETISKTPASTFQEINSILNAYSKVNTAMQNLSALIDESNQLIATFIKRVEEIKIEQLTEKERVKRAADTSDYNSQYESIALTITSKNAECERLIEEISKMNLSSFDYSSLFKDPFNELLNLSGSNISNGVSEYANKAIALKSKFHSLIDVFDASAKSMITSIEQTQAQLKQLNADATAEDVYARPSIDDVKSREKAIEIPVLDELKKQHEETVVVFNEMSGYVATAYDIASAIDSKFASYKTNSIQSMINTLSSFENAIDLYQEQANEVYQSIINNSTMIYCRYAELHNAIIAPSTNEYLNLEHNDIKCESIIADNEFSIAELYSKLVTQWNSVFDYASKKQVDNYNSILDSIYKGIDMLKNSTEKIDAYIKTYNELTREAITAEITKFKSEIQTMNMNKETTTLTDAQKARDIAVSTYEACSKLIASETASMFETMKSECESAYHTVTSDIYSKLTSFINVISTDINERKRNIIRLVNSAKLLSYLFGHYYIGRYTPEADHEIAFTSGTVNKYLPWTQWLYAEIKACVSEAPIDVFKTLCLYSPVLPLIWPYGSSDIEKRIQLAYSNEKSRVTGIVNGSQFALDKKQDFEEYIKGELVRYIFDAIVNTMDKTVYSPLEEIVNDKTELQTIKIMQSQGINEVEVENTTQEEVEVEAKTISINDFLKADAEYRNAVDEYDKLKRSYDEQQAIMKVNEVASTYSGDDSDMLKMKDKYNKAKDECNRLNDEMKAKQTTMNEKYALQKQNYEQAFKKFETSASACSYFNSFINDARALADNDNIDSEFASLCCHYLNSTKSENRYHNYWKLLVTGTDKLSNITYTPTFFPSTFPLTNPRAEKREAIITILNRIFSKFGYPSYDIAFTPSQAAQPVPLDDNQSLGINVIPGGQCISYYDGNYFNKRMHLDENGEIEELFSISKLIEPSMLIVSDSSDYNLSMLSRDTTIKKRTISNSYQYYLGYKNPTAIFDYLFNNNVAIETLGLDCIGIDNYLHESKSEETTITELIDVCLSSIEASVAQNDNVVSNMKQSTDYMLQSKYADIAYNKGLGYALSWSLVFPKLKNEYTDGSLGYYPISKINTVMFSSPIVKANAKEATGFGNCIYEIFNGIQQLSKSEVLKSTNTKL